MTRNSLACWIKNYETAWRATGTEALGQLFAPRASYLAAPFDEPLHGIAAIAEFWEAERDGADEEFVLASELIAVDGNVGVARIEVRYGAPIRRTYRDIWIITHDAAGRATAFEEWPFFPGRPRVAP